MSKTRPRPHIKTHSHRPQRGQAEDLNALETIVEQNEQLVIVTRERDQLKRNFAYSREQSAGEIVSLERRNRRLQKKLEGSLVLLVLSFLLIISLL